MCRSGSIKQKLLDFIPKKSLVNQVCFWKNFFYGNKKCNIIQSQEISFKFIFFFQQKVIFEIQNIEKFIISKGYMYLKIPIIW